MDLELRHLRIVCAVAEAGSVTKAAATLGLAQPAVTAQLRRIERSLGGQLFERGRHGVTPTQLGELVLTRARVLLPAAQELRDDAVKLAAAVRTRPSAPRRIRLGTTGSPYLAGMVEILERADPETDVVMSASFRALELLDQVRADRLDCAAIGCCGEHGLPMGPGLEVFKVAVEPVCVMLAESHSATNLDEVPLEALSGEHWAWLPGDGCLHEHFVAACVRAGFHPRTGYESDAATCIEMARTGRAVALCLPTRRAPGVVVRPMAGAPLRWVHAMVWRDEAGSRGLASRILLAAAASYREVLAGTPEYLAWLENNPSFGPVRSAEPGLPAGPR
jgi:DNA-binding transcriptional LysR family regulator